MQLVVLDCHLRWTIDLQFNPYEMGMLNISPMFNRILLYNGTKRAIPFESALNVCMELKMSVCKDCEICCVQSNYYEQNLYNNSWKCVYMYIWVKKLDISLCFYMECWWANLRGWKAVVMLWIWNLGVTYNWVTTCTRTNMIINYNRSPSWLSSDIGDWESWQMAFCWWKPYTLMWLLMVHIIKCLNYWITFVAQFLSHSQKCVLC